MSTQYDDREHFSREGRREVELKETFQRVEAFEQAEQEQQMWEQRRAHDREAQERQMWNAFRATEGRTPESFLEGNQSILSEQCDPAAPKRGDRQSRSIENSLVASAMSGERRDSLRVPQEWLERRLEQIAPDLSQPAMARLKERRDEFRLRAPTVLPALRLSYNPRSESFLRWTQEFRLSADALLAAIQADLGEGISASETAWKAREGQSRVLLSGTRWQVVVRPQQARDSGQPLAVLHGVKRLDIPTNQLKLRPKLLSFHAVWDEVSCRIESWLNSYRNARHEHVEARRQARSLADRISELDDQREQVLADAARQLRRGQTDAAVRNRARLHRSIRQQYSALRVMMEILELRVEREVHVFEATVVPSKTPSTPAETASARDVEEQPDDRPNVLCLKLPKGVPGGVLEEDTLIELRTDSSARAKRAPVRSVARVDDGLQLEVDIAEDAFEIGTSVKVRTVSRFSMWAHSRAVSDLLDERVQGRWSDLARLLVSPDGLDLPPVAPCNRFFNQNLNDRQRRAVAGALSTPHCFCIQGPPGTGKTTVICELVEQLIAKGERILLVAPTHVAVDEVLRRIGSRGGVRALRLAWNEAKVDEDVRKYTPTNILEPFLRRAGDLDDSRRIRWREAQQSLAHAGSLLDALRESQQALDRVQDRWRQAASAQHDADTAFAMEGPKLKEKLERLRSTIADAQREVAAQQESVVSAEAHLGEQKSKANWLGTAAGWVGLGSIGKAKRALARAREAVRAQCEEFDALENERNRTEGWLTTLQDAAASAGTAAQALGVELAQARETRRDGRRGVSTPSCDRRPPAYARRG
jgi:DNA polymerase III delta prime subunit